MSVARIGSLPLRSNADLQQAIMVLRLANAQTKAFTRLAENSALQDQVSAGTSQVDQLLDELRARVGVGR